MNIEVLFFGDFRKVAPRQRVISVTEDVRLAHVIERLVEEYGSDFHQAMDDKERLRILVNGREYDLLDGMETPLKDGDVVAFIPLITGG